jgi:sirohydrochlorin ferrochelatase
MRSLLLVAHGSRRAQSNEEIRALTEHLSRKARDDFDLVLCAFLELAEPSIAAGIDECINRGASQVVILPYFLSAGRHVVKDIPAEVEAKQKQFPQVVFKVAPYLGAAEGVPDLLLSLLPSAVRLT